MSRSSKGFADFFPTAPSVIQQKKRSYKAALQKKKEENSDSKQLEVSQPVEVALASQDHGGSSKLPTPSKSPEEGNVTDQSPNLHYDSDSAQAEMLNGVGSASSTSTTSVFSSEHPNRDTASHEKTQQLPTLTPLTNNDSSPPMVNKTPPHDKKNAAAMEMEIAARTPESQHIAPTPEALTPVSSPKASQPKSQPSGKEGDVVGFKMVYDPELDKTLSSKERRSRKAITRPFREEVGFSNIKRSATRTLS